MGSVRSSLLVSSVCFVKLLRPSKMVPWNGSPLPCKKICSYHVQHLLSIEPKKRSRLRCLVSLSFVQWIMFFHWIFCLSMSEPMAIQKEKLLHQRQSSKTIGAQHRRIPNEVWVDCSQLTSNWMLMDVGGLGWMKFGWYDSKIWKDPRDAKNLDWGWMSWNLFCNFLLFPKQCVLPLGFYGKRKRPG